jgi:outer membrane protein OmpA-like peptidoglycan-associated protein
MPCRLTLCTLLLALTCLPVLAEDHPLIRAYAGSAQQEHIVSDFDRYQRIIGANAEASLTEAVEGRVTRLRYRNPPERSTLEILSNYRQALETAGLKVDYACEGHQACASTGVGWKKIPGWSAINGMNLGAVRDVRYFTGRLQTAQGSALVAVGVNPQVHYIHVVELGSMQSGQVLVDAAALGRGLDREGRVVVEGIFFDTDSATLQSTSDAALQEVAQLLGERPDLRLYVVGHTDSQGSLAHNLKLSAARAGSVVEALAGRFGIPRARLDPHGVGPLSPQSSNAGEAGRMLNRRVELVAR